MNSNLIFGLHCLSIKVKPTIDIQCRFINWVWNQNWRKSETMGHPPINFCLHNSILLHWETHHKSHKNIEMYLNLFTSVVNLLHRRWKIHNLLQKSQLTKSGNWILMSLGLAYCSLIKKINLNWSLTYILQRSTEHISLMILHIMVL